MKDFEAVLVKNPLSAMAMITREAAKKALKSQGILFAAALRTVTPPHGDGAKMATTKNKSSVGINKLKERIAVDIRGAGDSSYGVTPVRSWNGRWLAFKDGHYTDGGGNFGLVVPKVTSFTGADGKKYPVPFVKPAEVHQRRVFHTRRGAKRAMHVNPGGVYFVRKTELDRYVAKKQKMAGFTISGWRFGAKLFATGKTIDGGFFMKLRGRGNAGDSSEKHPMHADLYDYNAMEYYGFMENGELDKFKGKHKRMIRVAREMGWQAAVNMQNNIVRWYKKKAKEIVG